MNLKEIQGYQLKILLEVKKICEKNNIKYFLSAGTLLGAVRHKGFIPWDDDLDIGMLRSEYDKFLNIAEKELSSEYFLQTLNKVRLNNTIYREYLSRNCKINSGIYIDIFPYDNVPDSKLLRTKQKIETYILKRLLLMAKGYEMTWENSNKIKKYVCKIARAFLKLIDINKLKSALLKSMKKYSSSKSKYIINIGGAYGYKKQMVERLWMKDTIDGIFEGYTFPIPVGYDYYLKHLYGDYLKLPPEDKRYNRHNIMEISLGDFKNNN